MKDRPRRRTKPITDETSAETRPATETSEPEFKITSRADREKKFRMDSAQRRADDLCQRWLGSTESGPARVLRPVFYGLYYAFPQKDSQEKSGFLVTREKKLRESLHTLAESLPQLVYDRFTLTLLLAALVTAGIALAATGNLWWFIFIGLGMVCFTGSTLSLKYGITGWCMAMILMVTMLWFFMEPKIISLGAPSLYRLFQLW